MHVQQFFLNTLAVRRTAVRHIQQIRWGSAKKVAFVAFPLLRDGSASADIWQSCTSIFGIFRLIDDDDQLTEMLFGNQSREQGRQPRVHFGQNFLSGSSKLKVQAEVEVEARHQKDVHFWKCVPKAKEEASRRWQDSNLRPRRELISSQSH